MLHLEVSKLIGQPINESLPVPVAITEIADVYTAEPGEKVYRFDTRDTDADEILDVNTTTGAITTIKRSPVGDTELTFKHLESQWEYVLVSAVLDGADQAVFGRKKGRITASLDKLELRCILNAILDGKTPGMVGGTHALEDAISAVSLSSGEDLYDIIMEMKHALEDYGDNYALLCGSLVKEGIDLYDKRKADNLNYSVNLPVKLASLGINVRKIFGTVKWTGGLHNIGSGGYADDSGVTALLNTNYAVMVARNSTIAEGKPIAFVRRKITPDIAKLMGAEVDTAQRALFVSPVPTNVAGVNTSAFACYGYESLIWAILNPKAISKTPSLASIIGANL